jgi:hypothetical protein
MIAARRLQALQALREVREREARQAWVRQTQLCTDQRQQLQNLALEHRRQLDAAQACEAEQGAALLGCKVERQQLQRYQASIAEGLEIDQYYVGQTIALTDRHTQAQACLETLRQQHALRQRQCLALRNLCEQADRQALRAMEWREELEAEDLPGARPHE